MSLKGELKSVGSEGIRLAIDGQSPLLIPLKSLVDVSGGQGLLDRIELRDPAIVTTLIASMRDGHDLRVASMAHAIEAAIPVSLEGLAEALLFIDEA